MKYFAFPLAFGYYPAPDWFLLSTGELKWRWSYELTIWFLFWQHDFLWYGRLRELPRPEVAGRNWWEV